VCCLGRSLRRRSDRPPPTRPDAEAIVAFALSDIRRSLVTAPRCGQDWALSDSYFLPRPRCAPRALLAIAFPPCLTARPASRTADAAPPAARFAWLAHSPASRLCRVPAARFPAASDFAFLRLRSRVAAPFFAAAERSALVCAITSPISPSSTPGQHTVNGRQPQSTLRWQPQPWIRGLVPRYPPSW